MKYTSEIQIELPGVHFIQKPGSPDNLKHWQRGLTDYKLFSGKPGEDGAKMELHHTLGKRQMILVETIIKSDFPAEFHAIYAAKGVRNIQKNYFKEVHAGITLWISESEFEFPGFFMKLMAFFMPAAFQKQSQQYAGDFKAFAEDGISVAEA